MNQTALTSRILALARPLLLLLLALTAFRAMALGPEWWTTQNVLTVGTPADDYAAINQGQLKNLVSGAVAAMDTSWPDEGAGYDLHDLVQSWLTPTNQTDDYAAVTLGQLKAVSAPVYDRLISVGLATAYPWNTANTPAPDDYALANIGQAKALFAFDLNGTLTHHLPASWLARYPMSGTGSGPDDDFDGDGLSNYWEYLHGKDPRDFYNGQTPTLQLVSGGGQWGAPGEVLAQPVTVSVNNGASNAPVTFSVGSGGALLSSSPNPSGQWTSQLSVRSTSNGSPKAAKAYVKLPPAASVVSTITASAGSGTKTATLQTIATTYDTTVPTPTGLQAAALSDSAVRLTWVPADVTRATSIEISKDNGASWQLYEVAAPGVVSFDITGLSFGQHVLLRVITGDELQDAPAPSSGSASAWDWVKGYAGVWGDVWEGVSDHVIASGHRVSAAVPQPLSQPTDPVSTSTVGPLAIEYRNLVYSHWFDGWFNSIYGWQYDFHKFSGGWDRGLWHNFFTYNEYDNVDHRADLLAAYESAPFDTPNQPNLSGSNFMLGLNETFRIGSYRDFTNTVDHIRDWRSGEKVELHAMKETVPNSVEASPSTKAVDQRTYLVLAKEFQSDTLFVSGYSDYLPYNIVGLGTLAFTKYADGHTTIDHNENLPSGAMTIDAAAQKVVIKTTIPDQPKIHWATQIVLTPVEIEVKRGGIPNSNPTWMSQGGTVKDVVAIWDVDDSPRAANRKMDWIKVRVKIAGLTDGSQLPPETVTWTIPAHPSPPANALETPELRWPGSFGIKTIRVTVAGKEFKVNVDVPDVGSLSQAEWVALMHLIPDSGDIGAANAWLHAQIADSWSKTQTQFSESRQNALEHGYWMSLCSSDVFCGPLMAWLLGTAHEHNNKAGGISTPFESTMDLHNNLIGVTVIHPLDLTGSTIKSELISKLANGTLWIWDHPLGQFQGIRAVKRADDLPIFPTP